MSSAKSRSGFHTQFGAYLGRLASQVSWHVRKKMFRIFSEHFPNPEKVLDLGVTSESVAPEANFFEELFPWKDRITAAGIEDAFHLESKYPGLRFQKIQPGQPLPFQENQFDVSFSNAVIEHVVQDPDRLKFVQELMRVSKHVFLTTPNKYFPIEPHTGVPLLHFVFPALFDFGMNKGWFGPFYNTENLRLLSLKDLKNLASKLDVNFEIKPVRFCGFISNWILILKKEN